MFKKTELLLVNSVYFILLKLNSFCITLRSKNTGHFWHITVQEYGKVRRFELYHRHKETDEYHLHGHAGSLEALLASIKQHNLFHLNGRINPTH